MALQKNLRRKALSTLSPEQARNTLPSPRRVLCQEYVEEMCQVQVMDVDFFVQRLGNVEDCSELPLSWAKGNTLP